MALADWDRRLISPEAALWIVGDQPVYFTCERAELSQFEPEGGGPRRPDQLQINMRHGGGCGQSVCLLAADPDPTAPRLQGAATTQGDLITAILRHLVTAHDQPLSGVK
jgi:hypothetical protein